MSSKSISSCFTWLVSISPLVVPIRKACLTCPVLVYEWVSHVSPIPFLTNKFEGTVNIKINIFTSFNCWYGLQMNWFCMRISKSTVKHWSHSNCSPVLFVTLFHCLLFLPWTCDKTHNHCIQYIMQIYSTAWNIIRYAFVLSCTQRHTMFDLQEMNPFHIFQQQTSVFNELPCINSVLSNPFIFLLCCL
jgi:hypothetical protein